MPLSLLCPPSRKNCTSFKMTKHCCRSNASFHLPRHHWNQQPFSFTMIWGSCCLMLDNKKRILCRCENENNRTFMMRLPFDYCLKVHNVSIANFWTSKEKKSETNQQKRVLSWFVLLNYIITYRVRHLHGYSCLLLGYSYSERTLNI